MRRAKRSELTNHLASQHDEDGIIRNGRPAGIYIPRDPARRNRLMWALRQARINKEASHI
jgi:hypothetical protein